MVIHHKSIGHSTYWLDSNELRDTIAGALRYLARNDHKVSSLKLEDLRLFFECYQKELNRDEHDETHWAPMWSTDLYNNHSGAYCELLSYKFDDANLNRIRERIAAQWEEEQAREAAEWAHYELNSYLEA